MKRHDGPVDPVEILSDIASDPGIAPSVRVRACEALLGERARQAPTPDDAVAAARTRLDERTMQLVEAARRRMN
jgi:hypothetical protein